MSENRNTWKGKAEALGATAELSQDQQARGCREGWAQRDGALEEPGDKEDPLRD